jgi:hypothetical protein
MDAREKRAIRKTANKAKTNKWLVRSAALAGGIAGAYGAYRGARAVKTRYQNSGIKYAIQEKGRNVRTEAEAAGVPFTRIRTRYKFNKETKTVEPYQQQVDRSTFAIGRSLYAKKASAQAATYRDALTAKVKGTYDAVTAAANRSMTRNSMYSRI